MSQDESNMVISILYLTSGRTVFYQPSMINQTFKLYIKQIRNSRWESDL